MAILTDKEKYEIMDELMQEVTDQILYEITNKKKDRPALLAELDALTSMKERLYARINK
jgi:hypothetical protein